MTNGSGLVTFRIYEWREYPTEPAEGAIFVPNPHYAGFRVKLLVNPTKGEVRQEQQTFQSLGEGAATEEDWYRVVAPRVVAWSLMGEDIDGNETPVPAPGEHPDNWVAFDMLSPDVVTWLVTEIKTAHVPKRLPSLPTMTETEKPTPLPDSVGNTDGTTPTPSDSEPTLPTS